MRRAFALSISILILSLSLVSAAGKGGINVSIDLENTGISSVSSNSTFNWIDTDQNFTINVTLDDDSNYSNTSIELWTQICVNSGLCHPPNPQGMIREAMTGIWFGKVDSIEDQTYVNWYFNLVEGENETRIPDNGWGWTVWSDCWFDGGEWGGDNCPNDEVEEEEESFLPALGIIATTGAMMIAAVIRRD